MGKRLAGWGTAAAAIVALLPGSAQAGTWLAGDLHVHTTYSHDSYGGPGDDNTGLDEAYTFGFTTGQQFRLASLRGLDYLAITDHNDIRSQSDPGFGAAGMVAVPAYENSVRGHAQMLGATRIYDSRTRSAADVGAMADELRAGPDDGVFQINHPASESVDFPDDIDWGYGYDVVPDSVEVWNLAWLYQPPLPSSNSDDDALAYWEGWLDRGYHVAATGGSDSHWVSTSSLQGVGQPTTWIYAERRRAAALLDGIRQGRTFVSFQPPALGGPRLILRADGDGDGAFESLPGDTVPASARLRVRVLGAPGAELHLIADGGREPLGTIRVGSSDFRFAFRPPAGTSWMAAYVAGPDLRDRRRALCDGLVGSFTTYCRNRLLMLALSSAIFVSDR